LVEIQVGKDHIAMVDDADAALVLQFQWHPFYASRDEPVLIYAKANVLAPTKAGRRLVRMHRMILGAQRGETVDHRNHNGLDNQRHNLRYCTSQQNQFNSRVRADNLVGIKGVGPDGNGRWRARATLNYQTVRIGTFDTPQEAQKAYVEFAKQHHGEFYCIG